MLKPIEPPRRTYVDPISDSARWQAFTPRAGDIVVTTPAKSGTTWAQSILAMLIAGDPEVDAQISMKSPWIDMVFRDLNEVMDRLAAQEHRRQVKSHTPFDGLPIWSELRYITVYRHPIDVHFSFRKHHANMNHDVGLSNTAADPSESFRCFLEKDGGHESFASLIEHYLCTLKREPRENFLRLHYQDMTRDLSTAVDQIAKHVGLMQTPAVMADVVRAATFASMKSNADRFAPSAGQGFWKQDTNFFDSASSNKWEGHLTQDDLAAYDACISKLMTPSQRAWLEWGTVVD